MVRAQEKKEGGSSGAPQKKEEGGGGKVIKVKLVAALHHAVSDTKGCCARKATHCLSISA